MLTVAQDRLNSIAAQSGKKVSIHLFGQEINPETYAIAKADMMLKGDGEEALHIAFGSTLSSDQHATRKFDFMLANPPYGKSWKTDADKMAMGKKKEILDTRFNAVTQEGEPLPMIPRSSDGQLLFLLNNISKMKQDTPLGSRIVEVHNGSSLFTGDAGSGESNARRYMIENDLVEAIIALPEKMFYNTGIGTYIWVLSNRKEARRQGKIQLIDATGYQDAPCARTWAKRTASYLQSSAGRSCASSWILRRARSAVSSPTANLAIGRYPCSSRCSTRRATPCSTKRVASSRTREKSDTEIIPFGYEGRHRGLHGKRSPPLRSRRVHRPQGHEIGYELSLYQILLQARAVALHRGDRADLRALEQETDGMLAEILGGIQG